MQEKKRSVWAGLWVMLAKLGPKVFGVLLKVLKTAKWGKLALAAGSMASYTMLYSWKFAAALLSMIFLHEMGHLLAMKQCGMKTKGIYLIPFFGGLAVGDGQFATRGDESYIAIAGPIVGLVMSVGAMLVYQFTGAPIWAAIAGWWALINLFNLFPINPLDGGRIMKSVAFSMGSWIGLVFMALGMAATVFVALKWKLGLLAFIGIIGMFEFLMEFGNARRGKESKPRMGFGGITASVLGYAAVAGALLTVIIVMKHAPGADIAMQMLQGDQ